LSLFINKDLNSLIITPKDFNLNYNYLPDILLGLYNLDPEKKIKIALDLKEAPAVFVLYFRKLMQESNTDIDIYYRDKGKQLQEILSGYGMQYKSILEYPDALPQE
jgi:hypothetical protein